MRRTEFLPLLLLAMFLLCAPASQAADQPASPNVIVIVADDLGYSDVGAQGLAPDIKTPNIDSIAANGVRFTNGYVTCPVCSPSRAGFLTGRYQERFGHELNPLPKAVKSDEFGLATDQVTIADEMRRAGYATGIIGKWHEGYEQKFRPLQRGFDEYFGFLGGGHGYMGLRSAAAQGVNAIRRQDEPVDEKEYLTEAISREAIAFVKKHEEKPFFLYVAYNAVHTPQQAPQKYQDRFPDAKDPMRKLMLAMLSAEDDGIGRLLAQLRDDKLEENTLVVFFSDNGGPTGANGSRNKPLRGYKGQIWEGGIRIPFMMQWKGKIEPGQVKNEPVITVDLLPTAMAAAGTAPRDPSKLDGVNLLPWLTGKVKPAPHETLYWRFTPQWAVRDGNYKLLHTKAEGTMLFDLEKDVGEKTDLTKTLPEVAARLQAKYEAWNKELHEPLWPGKQEGEHQGEKREANGSGVDDD
jgi:arylsulfatase A-like enzyme